ncbi:MAG: MerR family transcriptional regulator [Pseudomonadota bacterium]
MPHNIAREVQKLADDLGVDRKRSIGEVAKELKVETHVIRFWEENFPQIKPEIGAGKRRYYYNKQLKILKRIKKFLYEEGYTVAGLQKLLKKRKHDDHKEEDLDIILSDEMPISQIVHDDEIPEENRLEDHAIEEFIDPRHEAEIEIDAPIDPTAKIRDFSKIKVSAIDPLIRKRIRESLKNIRGNLVSLKKITQPN